MKCKAVIAVLLAAAFPLSSAAQKFQIETNAVGLMCLGTLNAELNYAISRHWSLGVSGRYNPFTFNKESSERSDRMQLRQRCVSANAKWWPWHIYSGWWLSGKLQWQEYNYGGILSPQTEEGQRLGAGVSAGYSLMVSSHWNVDFGLGFWGGMRQYTVYACPTCGSRVSEGAGVFLIPNDIIVALSYVF